MKLIQTAPLLEAFFLSAAAYPSISSNASLPPPPTPSKYKNYVRKQCKNPAVLYPDLCYQTLVPFAGVIKAHLNKLAFEAANVSLSGVQDMMTCLVHQNKNHENSTELRPLADCKKTLVMAKDQIQNSLKRMRGRSSSNNKTLEAGDVKTWMSAALTNEDTCWDGLVASACNPSVSKNCTKYWVENITSNALALINLYYASFP